MTTRMNMQCFPRLRKEAQGSLFFRNSWEREIEIKLRAETKRILCSLSPRNHDFIVLDAAVDVVESERDWALIALCLCSEFRIVCFIHFCRGKVICLWPCLEWYPHRICTYEQIWLSCSCRSYPSLLEIQDGIQLSPEIECLSLQSAKAASLRVLCSQRGPKWPNYARVKIPRVRLWRITPTVPLDCPPQTCTITQCA